MIQIDDVVISLDVFREKFLCNLDACKGECCIEGDAGAPVELDEVEKLEEVLPVIWDELSPEARTVIDKQGVVYTDEEGDLVTSIVNQKDCVFTCYDEKGYCYCAIEKAFRAKITARQGKRLDIESAYIDAGQVIEDDKPCEKRYIHVFSEAGFPEITKPDILEIRKYKEDYLVLSYQRKLEGSRNSWEI